MILLPGTTSTQSGLVDSEMHKSQGHIGAPIRLFTSKAQGFLLATASNPNSDGIQKYSALSLFCGFFLVLLM